MHSTQLVLGEHIAAGGGRRLAEAVFGQFIVLLDPLAIEVKHSQLGQPVGVSIGGQFLMPLECLGQVLLDAYSPRIEIGHSTLRRVNPFSAACR